METNDTKQDKDNAQTAEGDSVQTVVMQEESKSLDIIWQSNGRIVGSFKFPADKGEMKRILSNPKNAGRNVMWWEEGEFYYYAAPDAYNLLEKTALESLA